MSIYYSGTYRRSAGVVSAIGKQLKLINLKPVKKISVQFDPFHENAKSVRDFLYFISSPKIVSSNLSCVIKTNVVCDRSQPVIQVDLTNSKSLKFLSENLTTLEILKIYNNHVGKFVKAEEEAAAAQAKTKPVQGKKRFK